MRAVFFDAVGTLLFPAEPVYMTYARHAAESGMTLTEATTRERLRQAFQKQEQLDRARDWTTNEDREHERWRTIVAEVVQHESAASCFERLWEWYRRPAAWRLHPETGAVLKALQDKNLILGMGSNFDARLRGLVESFPELAPVRERCLISSLVGYRKPGRRFFEELCRAADLPAPQIIFIGDDPVNDHAGALAAGMASRLLDPKSSEPHAISRLSEVLDLLNRPARER